MIRILAFATILLGALGADALPAQAAWPAAGDTVGAGWLLTTSLSADGSGGVVMVWRVHGPGQTAERSDAARVSGNGDKYPNYDWPEDFNSSQYFGGAYDSYTFPDGLGGAFFLYDSTEYDTTCNLMRTLPAGGRDTTWPVAGPVVGSWDPTSWNSSPSCVPNDGVGGAFVVSRPPTSGGGSTGRLVVRHIIAGGAIDPAWPAAGLQINPGSLDYDLSPVRGLSDAASGAVFTWTSNRMKAQRVTGDGSIAPGWPPSGIDLSDAGLASSVAMMEMVPSGPDHFFVAWTTDAVDGRSLWLQRFHRDGTIAVGWPAGARLVATYNNNVEQEWGANARVTVDGSDGIYLAVLDYRGVLGFHFLADGSLASGWNADGLTLTDPGAQPMPASFRSTEFDISCGPGSDLIVTWLDQRSFPSNLLARWIRADGSPDPNQPAYRVVTPTGTHPKGPVSLSDGLGGVFVGWQDNTQNPIPPYSLQMLSWMPYDPSLVGVPPRPRERTLALSAWPNPARDAFEVQLALATESRAHLDLLDLGGRRVRSIDVQGAGVRTARFENLSDLAPGVYWLRLAEGNASRTTRVALIH